MGNFWGHEEALCKWTKWKDNVENRDTHTHTTVLRLCGICPGKPG